MSSDSFKYLNGVPIVGKQIVKLGKIDQLWGMSCMPSPQLWVYAFFYELPWLIWAFVEPDVADQTWNRLEPYSSKKGKLRFRIAGKYALPKIPVPRRMWYLWKVGDLWQKAGFFFTVVDASETFAINWMGTAYRWAGCFHKQQSYCQIRFNAQAPTPNTTGWKRMLGSATWGGDMYPGFYGIGLTKPMAVTFSIWVTMAPIPGGAELQIVRVRGLATGVTVFEKPAYRGSDGVYRMQHFEPDFGNVLPADEYVPEMWLSEGWYAIQDGEFSAVGAAARIVMPYRDYFGDTPTLSQLYPDRNDWPPP